MGWTKSWEKPLDGVRLAAATVLMGAASAATGQATGQATGPASCQTRLGDGGACLFIGHSYFVPVAARFDAIAQASGLGSHGAGFYFAGGTSGSPGSLWDDADDSRTEIEAMLAPGNVRVLGMTAFGEFGSTVEDYRLWIDLALSYNPDTRFFIGQPWVPGGPSLDTAAYDDAIETAGDNLFQTVAQLRLDYPNTRIEYINYGKTASIMKAEYEAGNLPDVTCLTGCGSASLFADPSGHAGPMMTDLCAASWFDAIYGVGFDELTIPEYQSDTASIVADVLAYNERFPLPPQDWNLDGACSIFDVSDLLRAFDGSSASADLNGDGVLDSGDVQMAIAALDGAP
ncbi:MAG: hypothetical protein AAFR38_08480 [Planctomycetota bacterium]